MKLIAIEEHYMSPAVDEVYNKVMAPLASPAARARLEGLKGFLANNKGISDLGELRLATMDRQGVDMQVISYGNNSPMDVPADAAVPLCQQANDELAEAVRTTRVFERRMQPSARPRFATTSPRKDNRQDSSGIHQENH